MNVLLVDDEPDMGDLFRQTFRREIRGGELKLYFVNTGEEALYVLKDEANPMPQLILSDIMMPGISGIELLDRIKELWPEIPVVMISALGDTLTQNDATSRGADGFLQKPVDFAKLRELLGPISGTNSLQ